jgi:hypothetical protein
MRVRPRRKRPEDLIQKTVIAHLKLRGQRDMLWWHTPMGGRRNPIEAAILQGLGAKAGVADLCFLRAGKFYSLEIKAPGRTSTEAQIAWRLSVNTCGGFASEAVGLDAAIRCLETWDLLRGHAA